MISLVEVYTPVKEGDVRAGIARFNLRRGSISTTFTYDDEFLANSCSYAIDPHMPLSDKTHHIRGLPGAFRDSAPDRWGRNLILRQSRAEALGRSMVLRAFDEVDFLISVFDQTRQGALRYRSSPDATWLSPHRGIPPIIQLPALLQASKQLAQEAEGKEALKLLLDAGSGSLVQQGTEECYIVDVGATGD